ncbi:response regulator [bacterium]|nr:response regulator [bacterium]
MKKTVLIVDDALFMRTILRNIVELAGYEVCGEAKSGTEAIEKFDELKPDLTILDIIIPEPAGNIVLGEILKRNPKANVLIVSAISQNLLIKKALEAGAKGYIIKPFDCKKVGDKIREILEGF